MSCDEQGNYADLAFQPEDGTFEVTGDKVVIDYRQGGVEHKVIYRIVGPSQ